MRRATSSPGSLGPSRRGSETRFAVYSAHATAVELCLFDRLGASVHEERLAMSRAGGDVWRISVPDVPPGSLYGFRADGPHDPRRGHRFNPAKLLVDPCARAVAGDLTWHEALLDSDTRDSAPFAPRSVVCDTSFDWQGDVRPRTPWERTLIYEAHVRGMTAARPDLPDALRGTFLGLASDPVVEHLLGLGVSAIELMPVQQFASERHLAQSGRSNYWGYSPVAWFAPHAGYAGGALGEQVTEFKTMVRSLHRAGLEVILDVVFNHSIEGDERGPTVSLRGLDNASYYRLEPDDRARYVDFTGCGNTIDTASPPVRRLILDCLRYWVEEMHVDGFRFDLGTTIGRRDPDFDARAALFDEIAAEPALAGIKLIAEPWDLGPGGRQVGNFPEGWREWNDRFRDSVRGFWRGDRGRVAEIASRLTGSSDLYGRRESGVLTGINYVACHDGFTLRDLVSYERKHNLDNGEGNRDGREENLSSNWGVEGDTDDPEIGAARLRAAKNLVATLAFSAGVPMLGHGDELGRTQAGNNNAYCQDGPLTWIDWSPDGDWRELLAFTRRVFELRRRLGLSDRREFFSAHEIRWLRPDGTELSGRQWSESSRRELLMVRRGPAEKPCGGFLLALNGGGVPADCELPDTDCRHPWRLCLETSSATPKLEPNDRRIQLAAYSLALLACSESPGFAAEAAGTSSSPASAARASQRSSR